MASTTVGRHPLQMIEESFADYKRPAELKNKPFDLLVMVSGREDSPGPRDERWEFCLDVGRDKIEKVLECKPIGAGPHHFVFPDRWLQPGESMRFPDLLYKNPDAKKFGRVYMLVNQPYIVGNCRREQTRFLKGK